MTNNETDLFGQTSSKILTVGELTRSIRGLLETRFGTVWVQGEISNYKLHPSGHQYFTLKDQRAAIACVIFRNAMATPRTPLADGAQVQVFGTVTVFEARGQYQLNISIVQARGEGVLQAKFEALKRKLDAEGLFNADRKRALPKFPRRVGIVTSSSGAAIRDILNVLGRRAPGIEILINPVRVQGSGAAQEIAAAIRELAQPSSAWQPVDVIVVARGGGSIEDLWEFNEEIVARAVFDSPVPIVSAIGHEIDFTITDFVADLRAPTPSAAAELIATDSVDVLRRIDELASCLHRYPRNALEHARTRLRYVSDRALGRELFNRLRGAQQEIDWLHEALTKNVGFSITACRDRVATFRNGIRARDPQREIEIIGARFAQAARRLGIAFPRAMQKTRERFARAEHVLRVLGPDATLGRGYSITTDEKGVVIRSATSPQIGQVMRTQIADGEVMSKVVRPKAKAV